MGNDTLLIFKQGLTEEALTVCTIGVSSKVSFRCRKQCFTTKDLAECQTTKTNCTKYGKTGHFDCCCEKLREKTQAQTSGQINCSEQKRVCPIDESNEDSSVEEAKI